MSYTPVALLYFEDFKFVVTLNRVQIQILMIFFNQKSVQLATFYVPILESVFSRPHLSVHNLPLPEFFEPVYSIPEAADHLERNLCFAFADSRFATTVR